tara:strand:+ start:882 stop:2417 length:1536 start_codon:yes stop_codon:yes gene_type:complete
MTKTKINKANELAKLLKDQTWRLNNLYRVQNEEGQDVPFVMNDAQKELWEELHYCNIIPKARQLGFSTFICIFILDTCLFRANTNAGTIDITLDDAKKKLEKIKFAYERLPEGIRKAVPLTTENKQTLEWGNGSSAAVGTSHRGGTLQILHVSEFGKISAKYPDKAKEIRTGAFGTVHRGQMIFIESTAEGAAGDFHDLTMQAQADQQEGRKLSPKDFKLHFFPWHLHKGYVDDPESRVMPEEMTEYFDKLEGEESIELSPEQRAWYVSMRRTVGPDEMLREYPATLKEAFNVSIEGAYFKEQMGAIRTGGRILKIPLNPSVPVNTFWDIGVDDSTSIWFHQPGAAGSHALVDYYEASGEGVDHYIKVLEEKRKERGWLYGKHFGPHDLDNRNWAAIGAKPIVDTAKDLGLKFEVVPRIQNKIDAINAARTFLSVTAIDETYCTQGIKCLDHYRKAWNERRADWSSEPLHDWSSHGADALMTGACGYRPAYVDPVKDRYGKRNSRRSAWAA